MFGYFIVGLIISFVDEAIPPMLIVSPILLGLNIGLSVWKKEFKMFWNGDKIVEYKKNYAKDSTVRF